MTYPSISKTALNTIINGNAYDPYYSYKSPIDLYDIHQFTNGQPFEAYADLRKNSPIYFQNPPDWDIEPGAWMLTSYKDIVEVSSNPKIFSSQAATGTLLTLGDPKTRHPKLWQTSIDHMLNLDGSFHLDLRKEHMPFFKPGYVDELHKKVEIKVSDLLDVIAKVGKSNLVKDLSQQIPIFTLSEVLGIPEEDRHKLATWMEFLELAQYLSAENLKQQTGNEEEMEVDPSMIELFENMVNEMFDYGKYILQEKRNNPQNDLLSAIANAELGGAKLSQEYLDGSWLLIIFAGNDTTRNSISGAIKLLTEFPEQKKKLLENIDLLPNFAQETIRMVSPVIHMRRTTTCETTLGNQKLGKGEKVIMWYGAANRDPAIFSNPNNFDIERENAVKHLAFGMGRHTCIGKPVALMQLKEVYKQILTRFPDMRMDGDWKVAPNNFVHAIQEMPVSFTPEK
tara:strand:- start:263 stop:1621 length:1359 start_codon:yes stop_codon:yes gene_type:complete